MDCVLYGVIHAYMFELVNSFKMFSVEFEVYENKDHIFMNDAWIHWTSGTEKPPSLIVSLFSNHYIDWSVP